MTRPVAVLRPEPGNARTAAAIAAAGLTAIRLPLFTVEPVAWTAPDPAKLDAVIATSANAFRHGGDALDRLRGLPVWAVGSATASAARAAGFAVAGVGSADAATLASTIPVGTRLLHLAGRERVAIPGAAVATVYAADPVAVPAAAIAGIAGCVALLHSARAARRLAALVDPAIAATIRVVAIAEAVAQAAGAGWQHVVAAPASSDAALVALARQLAD